MRDIVDGLLTSVPDASSIRFHTNLHVTLAALVADGFDPQNRRVGMRSDHGNRVARLRRSYQHDA